MTSPTATRSTEIDTTATRPRRARLATALVAAAAGAALALTGCSAGQVTQTSVQAAAVNGANITSGHIALRNVHVILPEGDSEFALESGGTAELSFFIVNNDPAQADRLLRITSNEASVTFAPQTVPAGGKLVAGVPVGQLVLEDEVGEDVAPTTEATPAPAPGGEEPAVEEEAAEDGVGGLQIILRDLGEGVTPGLTIPMYFEFERAGKVLVHVPVDAGAEYERSEEATWATHEAGH